MFRFDGRKLMRGNGAQPLLPSVLLQQHPEYFSYPRA
jgi:hypothetical protein